MPSIQSSQQAPGGETIINLSFIGRGTEHRGFIELAHNITVNNAAGLTLDRHSQHCVLSPIKKNKDKSKKISQLPR